MAHQDVSTSASGSGQPRSAVATVSDVSLVLIGLALIVSAFSNIPAQVSGSLVSVGLAAPGALPVRATFGVVGFALLLLGLARLFDLAHHAAKAWTWWKRRHEPPLRGEPGVNVGVPPPPNPLFAGRERELEELAMRLATEQRLDLSGLGGVGKTSVAVEYLHRHGADYPDGVFWLRGHDEATLVGDFADLAWLERLTLPERTQPNLELVTRAVTTWLRAHPRWLLVIDDLDVEQIATLDRLLAHDLRGHVLVTCRVPVWSQPVEVGPLAPDVAVDYLLARTRQDDRTSAAVVADLLEHLPLALEQAAAYVHDTGCPLAAYAEMARTRLTELMREGRPRDYPNPIATTWTLSFGRIEQESPPATAVLRLGACLAPDGIPLLLLRQAATQLRGALGVTLGDSIGLDLAIGTLRRYAMVRRQGETLRIHRLVQAVVRDLPTQREWTAVVLRVLQEVFPADVRDPTTWPGCASLAPHVQAVLATVGATEAVEPAATGWLLDHLGHYLRARGEFAPARPLLERALDIRERILGPDHPDTALSLNTLAGLLHGQGQLAAARPLFERALDIRERVLGPDHPDTAWSLNNLAYLLRAQGELAAARPLYERALDIRERVLGSDHSFTAWSLSNLAWLLQTQGELAAARPLFERALTIWERVLGPDHPDTAWGLNNLAMLLQDQGELAAARPLFERALKIRERVLGPDHILVITTRKSLDELLALLSDHTSAAAQDGD